MLKTTLSILPALAVTASLAQAQIDVSIGVRENGATGAIGSNGGGAGSIEWINRDGQTLQLNGEWQTFTFDFANDPITGFAGGTANGMLDSLTGTLEHIRLLNSNGLDGPINIWIDEITNTNGAGATVFGDFEGFADGDEVMFQEPGFSGSTSGNILPGSTAGVDNSVADAGTGSYAVRLEYSMPMDPTDWVRLTTFNTGIQGNPTIDFAGTMSFRMRGVRGTPGTFVKSGAGCPTPALAIGLDGVANIGNPISITCSNLPDPETAAAAVLIGTASQNVPLDLVGGTGCSLLVDQIFAAPAMNLNLPDADLSITIGCDPGSIGNVVFLQAAALAPGVNALGAVLSDLGELTIGSASNSGADECANAVVIGDGLVSGDTFCGTTSATLGTCTTIGNDVWYSYTATADAQLTVSFCSNGGTADFDTALTIFSGSCGSLVEEQCNDDTCGLQSEVSIPVTNGTTYLISIGGFRGAQGSYSMAVSTGPIPMPPSNDTCATATPVIEGMHVGTNILANTSAVTGSCGLFGSDVWYAYTATCDGTATASFCTTNGGSADFDTTLSAFDGSCGALTEITCNDDTCSRQSEVQFPVTNGTTYYIAVGGFNGAQGNFTLAIGCDPIVPTFR